MQLKVKKLTNTAKLPVRAYNTDSGLDLFIDHDLTLHPSKLVLDITDKFSEDYVDLYAKYLVGEKSLASTGISVQLPETTDEPNSTYELTIRPKSGLSSKGLYVALGTIDNSYTGELKVVMINLSNEIVKFTQGDKIAQLVVQKVYLPKVVELNELEERDRSTNGFGSTGLS